MITFAGWIFEERRHELSETFSFPIPKFGGQSEKIGLDKKNGRFLSKNCIFGQKLSFWTKTDGWLKAQSVANITKSRPLSAN